MQPDFLKELYFRELDGRQRENARATMYVAILTVVGGLLAFSLQNSAASPSSVLRAVTAILLSVAAAFYLGTLVFLLLANLGYSYLQLPHAEELQRYYSDLRKYYEDNPEVEGSADTEFADFLRDRMVSATTRNSINNLTRSARYYTANWCIAGAIVFSLLACVPGVIHKRGTGACDKHSTQGRTGVHADDTESQDGAFQTGASTAEASAQTDSSAKHPGEGREAPQADSTASNAQEE